MANSRRENYGKHQSKKRIVMEFNIYTPVADCDCDWVVGFWVFIWELGSQLGLK